MRTKTLALTITLLLLLTGLTLADDFTFDKLKAVDDVLGTKLVGQFINSTDNHYNVIHFKAACLTEDGELVTVDDYFVQNIPPNSTSWVSDHILNVKPNQFATVEFSLVAAH